MLPLKLGQYSAEWPSCCKVTYLWFWNRDHRPEERRDYYVRQVRVELEMVDLN